MGRGRQRHRPSRPSRRCRPATPALSGVRAKLWRQCGGPVRHSRETLPPDAVAGLACASGPSVPSPNCRGCGQFGSHSPAITEVLCGWRDGRSRLGRGPTGRPTAEMARLRRWSVRDFAEKTEPVSPLGRPAFEELESYRASLGRIREALLELASDATPALRTDLDRIVERIDAFEPSVSLLGQVKAGKSTLLNALIGRPGFLPADVNPWTSVITNVHLNSPRRPLKTRALFRFFDALEWERLALTGGRLGEMARRAGFTDEAEGGAGAGDADAPGDGGPARLRLRDAARQQPCLPRPPFRDHRPLHLLRRPGRGLCGRAGLLCRPHPHGRSLSRSAGLSAEPVPARYPRRERHGPDARADHAQRHQRKPCLRDRPLGASGADDDGHGASAHHRQCRGARGSALRQPDRRAGRSGRAVPRDRDRDAPHACGGGGGRGPYHPLRQRALGRARARGPLRDASGGQPRGAASLGGRAGAARGGGPLPHGLRGPPACRNCARPSRAAWSRGPDRRCWPTSGPRPAMSSRRWRRSMWWRAASPRGGWTAPASRRARPRWQGSARPVLRRGWPRLRRPSRIGSAGRRSSSSRGRSRPSPRISRPVATARAGAAIRPRCG